MGRELALAVRYSSGASVARGRPGVSYYLTTLLGVSGIEAGIVACIVYVLSTGLCLRSADLAGQHYSATQTNSAQRVSRTEPQTQNTKGENHDQLLRISQNEW